MLTLILAGCTNESSARRNPLGEGDALPALGLSGARPALVWAFDSADCLSCDLSDPAREIRRIQHRFGDGIEVVVVAVSERGDGDRALVTGFVQRERVSAPVIMLRPRPFVRTFGPGTPIPVVYLADRAGTITAVAKGNAALGLEEIVSAVQELVEEDYR